VDVADNHERLSQHLRLLFWAVLLCSTTSPLITEIATKWSARHTLPSRGEVLPSSFSGSGVRGTTVAAATLRKDRSYGGETGVAMALPPLDDLLSQGTLQYSPRKETRIVPQCCTRPHYVLGQLNHQSWLEVFHNIYQPRIHAPC
jgi:hypothetical protein